MVTFDATPSFTQLLLHKVNKAMDKRARNREAGNRTGASAHTLYQNIVRLLLHLSGFGCLTVAGFAFSFIVGMVVAGVCCFVMSTLLTADRGSQ